MASYDFEFRATDLTAQLNVNNALDERYYPTTYYGRINRIELGRPRSVVASIKARF